MSNMHCDCRCRCECTVTAIIVSIILGIVAAFVQLATAITVTAVFPLIALGAALVYLGLLLIVPANRVDPTRCFCSTMNTLLVGILGTILFSAVLLAVGITAGSILSTVLISLIVVFFSLTVLNATCLIRYSVNCSRCD